MRGCSSKRSSSGATRSPTWIRRRPKKPRRTTSVRGISGNPDCRASRGGVPPGRAAQVAYLFGEGKSGKYDNLQGALDLQSWLQGPIFEPLKDPQYFQQFFI